MLDVEPYLVELIKNLSEMHTPMITAQGLELANSLIESQSTEKILVEWKAETLHVFELYSKKLGKSYWNNFLKRNIHLIRAKKQLNLKTNNQSGATT